MTEQTQTTAGRIRAQIYYQLHGEFYSLETANEEVTRVSNAIAAEIDAKDAEIARLTPLADAWTPISTEPDEIDAMYLVATLDGRVGARAWCRDWMGNAPAFYLRDEDDIQAYKGEIAYWRKISPPEVVQLAEAAQG